MGTFCNKHQDCVRYCAYSKYGPEGASCCFPEKIRISKSNWLSTGSNTCYCCPADPQATEPEVNVYSTPNGFGMSKSNETTTSPCLGYLNKEPSGFVEDVSNEFCKSGKCIQAMVVMKLSFEHPSVCRSRKFPVVKE